MPGCDFAVSKRDLAFHLCMYVCVHTCMHLCKLDSHIGVSSCDFAVSKRDPEKCPSNQKNVGRLLYVCMYVCMYVCIDENRLTK